MKLYLCQMNIIPGKPSENYETIRKYVEIATNVHADIVVFPAFCLSGVMVGDLFLQENFKVKCIEFGKKIAELSKDVDIYFGNINNECQSTNFYASKGEFCDKVPNDITIKIDCSPFIDGATETRISSLSINASHTQKPIIYLNAVGTQNIGKRIFAFDGMSTIYNADGTTAYQFPAFENSAILVDIQNGKATIKTKYSDVIESKNDNLTGISKIHAALVYMIRENLNRMGIHRMVIGASGGIDSAVCAVLYTEAIGKENVFLINMPTRFNSDTTKNAARDLAENLGTPYMVAPISEILNSICSSLEKCSFIRNKTSMKIEGINYENLQARTRSASILATIASILGAGITCNGNKSEAMVGYCTLYGDTCGVMCAIGDLWKTQVYALANDINKNGEIIPKASLEIPASAELSEAMNVDEGKGDPIIYPYHDKLFAYWVEKNKSLDDSLKLLSTGITNYCKEIGVNEIFLKKHFPTDKAIQEDMCAWHRRYRGIALAKRLQFPPILTISSHPFGNDSYEAQI